MSETKIDLLRNKLTELRTKRDTIILEKGLSARENNDLRENFAYDYWVEQEMMITAKIRALSKEIEDISKQNLKTQPKTKVKKTRRITRKVAPQKSS